MTTQKESSAAETNFPQEHAFSKKTEALGNEVSLGLDRWTCEAQQVFAPVTNTKNSQYIDGICQEMEVLTLERGWVLIDELTLNDKIASLKDETFLEYVHPFSIEKKIYNGPIYKVENQYVDLMVTPDKMMFVQKSKTFKQKPFDFVRALNLLHQYHIYYRKTCQWRAPDQKIILTAAPLYSGGLVRGTLPAWEPNMEYLLKFFGFFIGDGWTTSYGNINDDNGKVTISQKKPIGRQYIEKVFEKLGLSLNSNITRIDIETPTNNEFKYNIYNRQLYVFLKDFSVGSSNKFLPNWIWTLSEKQCRFLLEGLNMSDGDIKTGTL